MDETTTLPETPEQERAGLIEVLRQESFEHSRCYSALQLIRDIERLLEWDDAVKLAKIRDVCEMIVGEPVTDEEA